MKLWTLRTHSRVRARGTGSVPRHFACISATSERGRIETFFRKAVEERTRVGDALVARRPAPAEELFEGRVEVVRVEVVALEAVPQGRPSRAPVDEEELCQVVKQA